MKTLQLLEEVVGRLENVVETANGTIVSVAGGQYLLTSFPENLKGRLFELVGARVGILRLSDGYRIRVLNARASPAAPSDSCRSAHTGCAAPECFRR